MPNWRAARASDGSLGGQRTTSKRGARAELRQANKTGLTPQQQKLLNRAMMVGAREARASWEKAATIGKCSTDTARFWYKRWKDTGSVEDLPKSGRKRKWDSSHLKDLKEVRALPPGWRMVPGVLTCAAGRR